MIDIEIIDEFYRIMEDGLNACGKQYSRPADYVDRMNRVLGNARNPVKNQRSGISKRPVFDWIEE